MNAAGFPILSLLTWLPLVGVVFIMSVRGTEEVVARNARFAALWTSLIVFLLSLKLWFGFDVTEPGFQFQEHVAWLPDLRRRLPHGRRRHLRAVRAALDALTPICILASWERSGPGCAST